MIRTGEQIYESKNVEEVNMTLTFDKGKTVIQIEVEKEVEYKTPLISISFSYPGTIHLTGKELDIFISALQIVVGNR